MSSRQMRLRLGISILGYQLLGWDFRMDFRMDQNCTRRKQLWWPVTRMSACHKTLARWQWQVPLHPRPTPRRPSSMIEIQGLPANPTPYMYLH